MSVCFAVTLDYKALLLLLQKWHDKEFVLGGKGYDNEFCAFCDAIRVKEKKKKEKKIVYNFFGSRFGKPVSLDFNRVKVKG